MEKVAIDINCDVGEGVGNEEKILPLVSSCSIACGGHAGDLKTMAQVAKIAKQHKVKVGAHPSYPDRENFGRVSLSMPKEQLIDSLQKQMAEFVSILTEEQISLYHIKAHGALYNDITVDRDLARTFLEAIEPYKKDSFLYVPFNSAIEGEALVSGFQIKYEAFGDRNYTDEGLLMSRKKENAVIQEPQAVLEHIARMVHEREAKLPSGKRIRMLADTYCIHGDTPSALEILTYISAHQIMYNLHIKK
ncbi:MAG: 5-oxoprolinase subunit PxpA [Maribacter sp.]|uniref:5-oxoprolinase subunit PxpA n=1 Tax=Maribacter sp. 2307UL18-2 TaxID=3386274 RepID=UPI0039BC981E